MTMWARIWNQGSGSDRVGTD